MKKNIYAIAVLALGLVAVSCEKDDKKPSDENTIVGEWSGPRDLEYKGDVSIHLSIKPDGTFEMVMPAWIERRTGTYNIEGNMFSFKINKLEWVVNRNNGYRNVYDQYGCWFKNDDWTLPDEEREIYDDPHAEWEKGWPEEASGKTEFSIDKGILTFKEGFVGLILQYVKDPDFNAEEAVKPHLYHE